MVAEPPKSAGPLDGIRVVDLSRILAGPLCTMFLGDLGADIVKVERPGSGDDTRRWGPPFVAGESAYYIAANRNKRGITLDLSTGAGQEVLARLVADADVVVDNFKPGTLEAWGLDDRWFALHAPQIIRSTISGYGSTGPKADQPGYDFVLQGETGLMAITGEAEGRPMKVGVALVDVCTGMMAAVSILAALVSRASTGRGQRADVNLHDVGLVMLANVASGVLVSGEDAPRYGNGHPNIVPYRTYTASDGDLVISIGNDAQFRTFSSLVGHPEWATDPRFATNAARVEHRKAIDDLIDDVVATRPRAQWIEMLQGAGLVAGPINTVAEALSTPAARDMVVEMAHPLAGTLRLLGLPYDFSETPASLRRSPPTLGQHTAEVLHEIGYNPDEVAHLEGQGVI